MANILVIDDDQGVLQLIKIILSHEGHAVSVAADGFQGLKLARQQRPDLILLDLMLPGIDGFEVCSRLRQDADMANVPVLIVSAKSQDTDRQAGAKVGANGYLTKPYQRSELLEQIAVFLDKSPAALPPSPSSATASGAVVTLVGARESEAVTHVIVNTAIALANAGARVTLADLRPFSVEHCFQLNVSPPVESTNLNQPETGSLNLDGLVTPVNGLRLLNNLEGSGEAGQITAADIATALAGLQPQADYVLLTLPLYPAEVLRDVATRSQLMAVVAPSDPAGLAAARSALTLLDRLGVASARVGLIMIGSAAAPDLGRTVFATLPAAADASDRAYGALVARLKAQGEGTAA